MERKRKSKMKFKILIYIINSVIVINFTILIFGSNNKYNKNKILYRDSILIDYVLNSCFRDEESVLVNSNFLRMENFELQHPYFSYNIGNIYYSPDSLKALVFYSYSYPFVVPIKFDTLQYFHGAAFAMFRDSLYRPWKCYRLDYIAPGGFSNKEQVWEILEDYYHKGIKHKGLLVLNDGIDYYDLIDKQGMYIDSSGKVRIKNGLTQNDINGLSSNYDNLDSIYKTFKSKYTLDDSEFWSESIVWKKGLRVPGYYNFQTSSHIEGLNQIIEYNIVYPDSIIEMYKKK